MNESKTLVQDSPFEWIRCGVKDSDGDTMQIHYLVNVASRRCYAAVQEPWGGSPLYYTDMKIDSEERWYTDLDAAKAFCECRAILDDQNDADNLLDYVEGEHHAMTCENCGAEPAEPPVAKKASRKK